MVLPLEKEQNIEFIENLRDRAPTFSVDAQDILSVTGFHQVGIIETEMKKPALQRDADIVIRQHIGHESVDCKR